MLHPTMQEFFDHLLLAGKAETVRGYSTGLLRFAAWLEREHLEALLVTTEHLRAFQRYLAEDYRAADGRPLARSTQVTRLSALKAYYGWLYRRGLLVSDPAAQVRLPRVPKGLVRKDYLSLQEATALLQTQARYVRSLPSGSRLWAAECRNLAILCLALATGRRRSGLLNLNLSNLDFERSELRCEREKGAQGRVLPVARWALAIAQEYAQRARPVLLKGNTQRLFITRRSPAIDAETVSQMLARVVARTVAENPDLDGLPAKHISMHSLRVTFAKLVFDGGCNIRSVNELLLHQRLGTTARYTPLPLEDLRRACRRAHPRG